MLNLEVFRDLQLFFLTEEVNYELMDEAEEDTAEKDAEKEGEKGSSIKEYLNPFSYSSAVKEIYVMKTLASESLPYYSIDLDVAVPPPEA